MRYDIFPKTIGYHGIDRSLNATYLYIKQLPKTYHDMLERFSRYLTDILEEECSKEGLQKLIDYQQELARIHIFCDVLVWDAVPVEKAYGYDLEFLGIDVTHDLCESLLADVNDETIVSLLNENGLCTAAADIAVVIEHSNPGNVEWEPCYVYRLLEK